MYPKQMKPNDLIKAEVDKKLHMLGGGFQRALPVPRRLWLRQRLVSQLVAAEDFLAFKDLRASSALLVSKRVAFFLFFFFFFFFFFFPGLPRG